MDSINSETTFGDFQTYHGYMKREKIVFRYWF